MYLEMVKRRYATLVHRVWRKGILRSGMLTAIVLVAAVVGMGIAYHEHLLGNFHKLKVKANIADGHSEAPVPRPGGQEAVSLMRAPMVGDSMPQFLSATILPGRGMNVLQITAYLPGRGEVSLMASPPLDEAAKAMTGSGGDKDLAMGGAFEVPWAGRIWGMPTASGDHIATIWRGRTIVLPTATSDNPTEDGGLMLARPSHTAETVALPDGGDVQAAITLVNPDSRWPSETEVTATVLLSGRSIELTVAARNAGSVAEPVGIGWRPRFAILEGNRSQLRLQIPGTMQAEVGSGGMPTGKLLPVAGTASDFTSSGGATLGNISLDDCFVALHQGLLGNGPVAALIDPASGYGLRLTALSPTIKAMCVSAPANGDFISIDPQFNYPDPLGREWGKDADTGMVVLQPGQSTQWKVRVELFSPALSPSPM